MMDRFLDNPEYPEDLFLKGPQAAELVDNNTMLVVVEMCIRDSLWITRNLSVRLFFTAPD